MVSPLSQFEITRKPDCMFLYEQVRTLFWTENINAGIAS